MKALAQIECEEWGCFVLLVCCQIFTCSVSGFQVVGLVKDPNGKVRWLIQGIWDSYLDMLKVTKETDSSGNARFETDAPIRIWAINPPMFVFRDS